MNTAKILMGKDSQITQNNWESLQENLTSQSGLAVVLVDDTSIVSKSNNNSICEVLYNSAEFSSHCAMFCGMAFEETNLAGKTISHQCHAGLHYQAVPIKAGENKQLVAITGRSFLRSEDYRKATERAIDGDWKIFPPTELFKNILLTSSEREIEQLSGRLEKLSDEDKELLLQIGETKNETIEETISDTSQPDEISQLIEQYHQNQAQMKIEQSSVKTTGELEEITAWRSLFGSLLDLTYHDACVSVTEFLAKRYQFSNLAWLENKNEVLGSVWSSGSFVGQQVQIAISAEDSRLTDVFKKETSLELRERQTAENTVESLQTINLFPVVIGGTVRSALAIGDKISDKKIKRHIARFIRQVTLELEILRLRKEISRQTRLTKAIQNINLILKKVDVPDFWTILAQNLAELMNAERASILIFDDESETLILKAAIGNKADTIKEQTKIGERVAQNVLQSGKPLAVNDMKKSGVPPAPPDWKYKTNSFISYPIVISERKIGVLNVTDKIDGGSYDERDLEILHNLAPQIAIALDRTTLIRKADEFELRSMTDSMTGLLNKHYLEVRLAEEISRSQRHGYPMSFMMIDVDKFKSYNDDFGHPEGDKALQLVGQCLKATLRGADVAARYGGEEFSILLPQTTLREAETIAERVREKVENARFPNRQVTVSIGLATCNADLCVAEELISAADKALYQAKMNGKNRVEIYRQEQ